jgi:tRNA(Ile)-lysidine synthetase-like protein
LRDSGETEFGAFRFLADPDASIQNGEPAGAPNPWRIDIPKSAEPVVRQWHPGDRLTTDLSGGRRRVKRFFADAGIVGPLRIGWPVVLCGDEVIWIPGVKASQDAVRREGMMVHYTCERIRD